MSPENVRRLLLAWEPLLAHSIQITLYGGEPLLAPEAIHQTAHTLSGLRPGRHSLRLTTNGSLLCPTFLERYAAYPSDLRISHEFWQERDPDKKPTDWDRMVPLLNRLMPGRWAVHSVLEPGQATAMLHALSRINPHHFPDLSLSLNTDRPWSGKERDELRTILPALKSLELRNRRRLDRPAWIRALRPPAPRGPVVHLMGCNGGRTKIAIDPHGGVWACERFWSLSHSHGRHRDATWGWIGNLEQETPDPRQLNLPYTRPWDWGQESMFTPRQLCHSCPNLIHCTLCPVQVLRTGASHPTCVPEWLCKLQQIMNTFPTCQTD